MNLLDFHTPAETLFNLSLRIIDALEEALSMSSSLTNHEIYAYLEEELGYSLSHIRNVFKLSTGMPLTKYITRRKYSDILLKMSYEDFQQLTMRKAVSGIAKFKSKCIHEFPFLSTSYSAENLQTRIDEIELKDLIETQLLISDDKHFFEVLYGNIMKDRIPYEIEESAERLIVQFLPTEWIDLEKHFFLFKNIVFRIKATCNVPQQKADPFLSELLGEPIILNNSIPADANFVVHVLHQFLTNNVIQTQSFSVVLEWGAKDGCGTSNLISSITVENNEIQSIEFVQKPFLLFDEKNVILDLTFFDR